MNTQVQGERSYKQFCGVAKALDVIGDRWTLLIARQLLLGPTRYGQLLHDLPGITTNLLAARLARLERAGIIEKVEQGDSHQPYRLTAVGHALEPVVMELGRWGGRFLSQPAKGERVNPAWGLLSLKRRYRGGLVASIEVEVGGVLFELAFSKHRLVVQQRSAASAGARITLDAQAFRALFFAGAELQQLIAGKRAVVAGDIEVVQKVLQSLAPFQPGVT